MKGLSKRKIEKQKEQYYSKPYTHLLIIEKGSVMSVHKLYKRIIKYKGEKIILGGFGGLCTAKKRRKLGFASILLKKGMEDLRKQKCEVAFLCTDIKNPKRVKLYGRFGFVVMKQPYTFLGKSGKRYTVKTGMIAPVRSKAKFNLIFKGKETLDIGYGGL